jgi:hypothetical protein
MDQSTMDNDFLIKKKNKKKLPYKSCKMSVDRGVWSVTGMTTLDRELSLM